MPWQLAWEQSAAKAFDSLPAQVQERVLAALGRLAVTEPVTSAAWRQRERGNGASAWATMG